MYAFWFFLLASELLINKLKERNQKHKRNYLGGLGNIKKWRERGSVSEAEILRGNNMQTWPNPHAFSSFSFSDGFACRLRSMATTSSTQKSTYPNTDPHGIALTLRQGNTHFIKQTKRTPMAINKIGTMGNQRSFKENIPRFCPDVPWSGMLKSIIQVMCR